MLGAQKQKHKKTAFCRCQCFAPVVRVVVWLIQALLEIRHATTLTPPSYEVGGIAKRIKTSRLRRKTQSGRDVILHVRP